MFSYRLQVDNIYTPMVHCPCANNLHIWCIFLLVINIKVNEHMNITFLKILLLTGENKQSQE